MCGQKAEFLNVEAGGTYSNNCALEFIFSCLPSTTQQYQDLKFSPFKTVTALHVWAYLVILGCVETRGNCCAFHTTAIGVLMFTVFLNVVNVVPPSMPHVLAFLGTPLAYQVCNVDVIW
jgi:hypothetical protein